MNIIAIDPGKGGGIAVYKKISVGIYDIKTYPMPQTVGDLVAPFGQPDWQEDDYTVILEEVGGYIGKPLPGSRMFNFGRQFGQLEGVLQALGFRVELVRPQKWQAGLGLHRKKGMKQGEWKNKLKAEAQRLYPGVEVTLKTADALLILEWARKKRT